MCPIDAKETHLLPSLENDSLIPYNLGMKSHKPGKDIHLADERLWFYIECVVQIGNPE